MWFKKHAQDDFTGKVAVITGGSRGKGGVIVNVSSGAGLTGFLNLVTYCASKLGVVGFMESLAQEVQTHGIRVYSLCPGRVATDMQKEYSGQRTGLPPEEVANKILSLAGGHPPINSG